MILLLQNISYSDYKSGHQSSCSKEPMYNLHCCDEKKDELQIIIVPKRDACLCLVDGGDLHCFFCWPN